MSCIYHPPLVIRNINQFLKQCVPDAFVSPPCKTTMRITPTPSSGGKSLQGAPVLKIQKPHE